MSEAPYAPEGQVIEGRYRVVSRIADGGMATVYQAVDERLGRTVAIKIMHTQLAQGPHRDQFVERFHREARSAAAIANPHIVQVYDTGEFDGLDYLVMEYVHGVNLRYEMNQQGTFSVRETLRIIGETLDGLASAHRAGVVHRDIKPENILLNNRGHVQITDFGLAKTVSQATLSSTGVLLGTAAYLAPEMIEKNQATPQGDLYSVGIMAWEMLAGKVPFTSDNPVTLVFKHVHEDVPSIVTACKGINEGVAAFLAHLTARAVEARPADASAALAELQRLQSMLAVSDWQYRLPAANVNVSPNIVQAKDAVAPMNEGNPAPPAPPAPPTQQFDDRTRKLDRVKPNMTTVMPVQQQNVDPEATTRLSLPPDVDANASDDVTTSQSPVVQNGDYGNVGKNKSSKKHHTPLIVAGVAALLLACGAGGWAWWYYQGPGSYWTMPQPDGMSCSDSVACPITGVKWSDYESLLKVSDIEYEVSEEYSDSVAEGNIISTDPANVGDRGSKRRGQKVKVVVSKGVRQATVPSDILDATSASGKDPINALKKAGFDNVEQTAASDDTYSIEVPQGALLSLSVDPGATLPHNTTITVTVSQGPKPVTMPDIVGKTKGEAQQAMNNLKLTANWTESFDDKIPQGQVISASVNSGDTLHWGDSVDVVVSKGPETITLPNYVGQKASDTKAALEKLGFTVKVSSQLTLDSNQDKKVASQDPVGGTEVRLRDENGIPTTITLKMYSSLF
ncbi:Stk1 family PASTA domain-containing Ser/Thr kinase [uncultured Bifidobacterium sp.]|uniref:Stk1 family PASTA domain-containing Ser/Thr kinase n=1 Tax=uncultured Bifidobacterium sp. TaxID=165187 RepID=UPI00265F0986|nr:Stk1 family PASTA domain-containing Ser/Thr kinase [uncultured Bifidobacterium sp.]